MAIASARQVPREKTDRRAQPVGPLKRGPFMSSAFLKRGLSAVRAPCILIIAACSGATLSAGGGTEVGEGDDGGSGQGPLCMPALGDDGGNPDCQGSFCPDGYICVAGPNAGIQDPTDAGSAATECVRIPSECEAEPTCACMGALTQQCFDPAPALKLCSNVASYGRLDFLQF
jgi:hypothetical protein